jgi:hypothetical protein
MKRQHGRLQHMRAAAAQSRPALPVLAGHVKKPDLLRMRPVEHTDRFEGGLQPQMIGPWMRSQCLAKSSSKRSGFLLITCEAP